MITNCRGIFIVDDSPPHCAYRNPHASQ
jgi:hypothetical protein